MENIILHTYNDVVDYEMDRLQQTEIKIKSILERFINKDIYPTIHFHDGETISQSFLRIVEIEREKREKIEAGKILKLIEDYGELAITEGWEEKVKSSSKKFFDELLFTTGIDGYRFDNDPYLQYYKIIDGELILKDGIDRDFFVQKNSIILSTKNQIERYHKHVQLTQLINELTDHPDNEFKALDSMLFFNDETKEFEMNIQFYDPEFSKLKLIEKYEKQLQNIEKNKVLANTKY